MKIGISVTSAYQTKDVRDGAAQMIARAREAADAGLDSLFVGDHHTMPTPYYQNTPMIGRMLAVSGVNYLCRSASIIFAGFSFPFFHSFVVVGDSFHLLI